MREPLVSLVNNLLRLFYIAQKLCVEQQNFQVIDLYSKYRETKKLIWNSHAKLIFTVSIFNSGIEDERSPDGLCFNSFASLADAKKHCETLEMIQEIKCDGVVRQSDGTYAGVMNINSSIRTGEKQELFLRLRRIWKVARSLFTEKGKLVEVWGEEQDGYYDGCAQVALKIIYFYHIFNQGCCWGCHHR